MKTTRKINKDEIKEKYNRWFLLILMRSQRLMFHFHMINP